MDPNLLEKKLAEDEKAGKLPSAVVVVDLYGISADFERIEPICAKYGVPILEDSAEALCSTRHGRKCGTFGKVAGFSFNGNKIITTSGGGALVSADEEIVKKARYLATQAREPRPYYPHVTIGYNYRLSNILAAVGCGQMTVLDAHYQKRRQIFDTYCKELSDIEGLSFMPEPGDAKSNRWLTVLQIDPAVFKRTPDEIRLGIEADNSETRLVWKPMHLQPVFGQCEIVGGAVGERIFKRGLCIPSGSSLSESDQSQVIDSIRRNLK